MILQVSRLALLIIFLSPPSQPAMNPTAAPQLAAPDSTDVSNDTKTFTPEWAKGAVFYQIFPERFRNGDASNDPAPDKKSPTAKSHPWTSNWYALTDAERAKSKNIYDHLTHRRYGGDMQGVLDKLDYLKDLGAQVIYFNPVFEAPSHHKYDASMFHHIDINFGPDPKGDLEIMQREDAARPETWQWTSADKLFLKVVSEAHRRGMRVVIDGVFNHVGRKFWAFDDLIANQEKSRYKDWFIVTSWDNKAKGTTFDYKGWWNIRSLPEFRKDSVLGLAKGPREHVFAATRRWMSPDGNRENGIDGWRLDVANEVPHIFWKDWRKLVRSINPDAYISGELWDNAAQWLQGDEFDAVMNYPFAKLSVNYFIDKQRKISASQFLDSLAQHLASYPDEVNHVLMNLFDSHDTDRLASMILNPDRNYDRDATPRDNPKYVLRKPNADERQVQKLMALFQMTYLGAPMLYYGTEAGMWSADDPDDRKPMLWPDLKYDDESTETVNGDKAKYEVKFDQSLFDYHK
ncbi:MAG: glycoside hydrolase family 13 protein, partial [Rhizobacter sp.]|nr:glycoside hydrolase family 13 protein [Chlorobiales bacterium]